MFVTKLRSFPPLLPLIKSIRARTRFQLLSYRKKLNYGFRLRPKLRSTGLSCDPKNNELWLARLSQCLNSLLSIFIISKMSMHRWRADGTLFRRTYFAIMSIPVTSQYVGSQCRSTNVWTGYIIIDTRAHVSSFSLRSSASVVFYYVYR